MSLPNEHFTQGGSSNHSLSSQKNSKGLRKEKSIKSGNKLAPVPSSKRKTSRKKISIDNSNKNSARKKSIFYNKDSVNSIMNPLKKQ